jgi:DNA adenine methylase
MSTQRVINVLTMDAPFGWPGGKKNLRKTLLQLIPAHDAYVEVFSGSAKLLFAKEPSQWEILNDVNDDLLNFFRVAKHRPAELAELLEAEIVSATRFKELRAAQGHAPELEQALRFIYLAWFSYGSKGEHFASTRIGQIGKRKHPVRKLLSCIRDLLARTAGRLRTVLIERRDFAECIRRYDSRKTFFYCDPPYTHFEPNGRYQPLGDRQPELFESLAGVRGKFLLSFDNCQEVRSLAAKHKFRVRRVSVAYSLGTGRQRAGRELLLSNF